MDKERYEQDSEIFDEENDSVETFRNNKSYIETNGLYFKNMTRRLSLVTGSLKQSNL